jgi:acyl carrier protein
MRTTAPSAIETTVVESLIAFGAKAADVKREATWEDIDVDSLDLAELAQVVEGGTSTASSWRATT